MDDFYNVRRLALILSVQAEIEGMKSANENCRQENHKMVYLNEDFQNKASELKNLAYAHNDQL
jgi:FtsZ-binding cell division protein ZapB